MAKWTRQMPWRQGALLQPDQLQRLPVADMPTEAWGVVVSHDCDLANDDLDTEPDVEVILAQRIQTPDGNCLYAKNPRLLHLPILGLPPDPVAWFELTASRKVRIAKQALAEVAPLGQVSMEPETLNTLQDWLAARYRRHALPEALVPRLDRVIAFLAKHGKKQGDSIIGFWAEYDPQDELNDDEPYELSLYIVYTVEVAAARERAEALAVRLRQDFADFVTRAGYPDGVFLGRCEALSEQAFTLFDLRTTVHLRFEYISNRLGLEAGRVD